MRQELEPTPLPDAVAELKGLLDRLPEDRREEFARDLDELAVEP